ncbi:protein kinase [Streptomyces fructofermentans]|uniref:protein kinase domain-containing protein n=1 Tax=Streptomyces fructofermentans TaxID=152141 RepID=UPI0033C75F6F
MSGGTPDRGAGRLIGGRYRLLRALGAGGMGRVWLAYDEELDCEVSIKEIALPEVPVDAAEPAQRIARARSEARNAARLRGHPHVATVHDVLMHEGLPWIVMEFVPDAVDLQAVVRRSGPLSPEQTARIGLAVLDALTAGHRIGILHRDVKPANILLAPGASADPYARVLLTDYGIALRPDSREPRLTATAGILGTPGYLAPERARGEPPTPAADLFSLGATLYAAVEGQGPFDRHGEYATLTALLSEEPAIPERAGELAPVLHGLLIKDPVRRLPPEAVARGLERVAQGPRAGRLPGSPPGAGPAAGGTPWPAPAHPPGGPGPWQPAETPGPAPGGLPGHGTPHTPHTPQGTPANPPRGGPEGFGTPRTPQTPQAPQTPQTPQTRQQTPQTPSTPLVQGGTPARSGATPDSWQGPGARSPYDPWNPYAGGPHPSPYAGGAPPLAFGSVGLPAPHGGGGVAPPYAGGAPGTRSRGLPAGAVVAIVFALVLAIGGGVWAVVSLGGGTKDDTAGGGTSSADDGGTSDDRGGPGHPYGEQVGLTEPLRTGDCVKAVWSGEPFTSVPNLGVVDCAEEWPDGQVVAVDRASDYTDARDGGAARCAVRSRPTALALPDAGVYAVTPTRRGFDAAGGATACLVLGRHAAIGGEVGRFRDEGTELWVGQMSVGDCWVYKEVDDGYKAPLTDCARSHSDQVIGTVKAPEDMAYKKGVDSANKLCGNRYESAWASGPERTVYGWVADEDDWNDGFTKAVCTVSRTDGTRTSGRIPTPGTA